jgi:hypothetical protein
MTPNRPVGRPRKVMSATPGSDKWDRVWQSALEGLPLNRGNPSMDRGIVRLIGPLIAATARLQQEEQAEQEGTDNVVDVGEGGLPRLPPPPSDDLDSIWALPARGLVVESLLDDLVPAFHASFRRLEVSLTQIEARLTALERYPSDSPIGDSSASGEGELDEAPKLIVGMNGKRKRDSAWIGAAYKKLRESLDACKMKSELRKQQMLDKKSENRFARLEETTTDPRPRQDSTEPSCF